MLFACSRNQENKQVCQTPSLMMYVRVFFIRNTYTCRLRVVSFRWNPGLVPSDDAEPMPAVGWGNAVMRCDAVMLTCPLVLLYRRSCKARLSFTFVRTAFIYGWTCAASSPLSYGAQSSTRIPRAVACFKVSCGGTTATRGSMYLWRRSFEPEFELRDSMKQTAVG